MAKRKPPGPPERTTVEPMPMFDNEQSSRRREDTTPVPVSLGGFVSSAPVTPRLCYVADGLEQERELVGSISIGRHTDNDLQLLDPEVSKHHLVLEPSGSGYRLVDLGSANGTRVNGEAIMAMELTDRDVIAVGNTELRFVAPGVIDPKDQTSPFDEMFSGALPQAPGERTMVTLVPREDEPSVPPNTSVFSLPMSDGPTGVRSGSDAESLERDYERLRVAFDLALEVGLELDLAVLGDTILTRIKEVLPADTAVIMLRSERGDLVPLASVASRSDEVRIPRALVDKVIAQKEGVLTSDAQADLSLRSSKTIVAQQIRSALCVPLVAGTEVVGILHLATSNAAGAYGERDLEMLRAIAQPVALAVKNARLMQRAEDDARMRADLSRFLSPALVDRVVRRDLSLERSGDKVEATVLFTDIRGFTAMSEGQNPEAVVSMLNEYFEAMVEVVFAFGGTLDKFIGDGMMAVWGTPVKRSDDAQSAVKAAQRMREVLKLHVNRARLARGEDALSVGYGVATGFVIAGAMGARRRQDWTVIGDTVNLSSRLCGQAAPGEILVCENTQGRCASAFDFQSLPPRAVKGMARPVTRFSV